MIDEGTVFATLHFALRTRGFSADGITKVHESTTGTFGDTRRAEREWSIFVGGAPDDDDDDGDGDDEPIVPNPTDATLVARTATIRFCRSLTTAAIECKNRRMKTLGLAREPKQLLIVADRGNIRTKKTAFYISATDDSEHEGIYVRIVSAESLMYNVLQHELVPKHVPIDIDRLREITAVYQKNRIDAPVSKIDVERFIANILAIGCCDPVAILMGGVPCEASPSGIPTVYEVQRPGGDIAYRAVVGDFGQ